MNSVSLLLAAFLAAGYRPEQVDLVLLTHLHKDHVGGILHDGAPAFPNAVVRAARPDADYWRDIVHVAALQLGHPEVTLKYDSDAVDARRARRDLLERAAAGHLLIGAAHIAFPGFGHVRRQDDAYAWIPLNYEADPFDPH
jgi:hypothetical protein